MTALRTELPVPTGRLENLQIDERGYPVPWFVAMIDGQPDHRVVGPGKIIDAVRFNLCWICGGRLGANVSYVIGPMCSVNRISAEPPMHRDCALYSVVACPFLTRPHAHRREKGLPEGAKEPSGNMLKRNPGVMLVWITRGVKTKAVAGGGFLFDIGEPEEWLWFCQGREATREEVEASIDSGLPTLQALAKAQGPFAESALAKQVERSMQYLPESQIGV